MIIFSGSLNPQNQPVGVDWPLSLPDNCHWRTLLFHKRSGYLCLHLEFFRAWYFWYVLLWRYSKPTWKRSCAACSRWPCFGKGFGLGEPQRSLPTRTIVWYHIQVQIFLHLLEAYNVPRVMFLAVFMEGKILVTLFFSWGEEQDFKVRHFHGN